MFSTTIERHFSPQKKAKDFIYSIKKVFDGNNYKFVWGMSEHFLPNFAIPQKYKIQCIFLWLFPDKSNEIPGQFGFESVFVLIM